jgi:hypothetical protein
MINMKVTYRHLELLFFTKSGGARAGWGAGGTVGLPTYIHSCHQHKSLHSSMRPTVTIEVDGSRLELILPPFLNI